MTHTSRTQLSPSVALGLTCAVALITACSDDGATARTDELDAFVDSDAVATDLSDGNDVVADAADGLTQEPDVPAATLRVTTLNLRCLIDDWADRLPIIVGELAALDPDLMGFQEACDETGADNLDELVTALAAETGREYHVERVVTHRAWERYNEGIAVVSAVPIADVASVALPGGVFTRRVIMIRVTTEPGPVAFATTHLDHQSDTAREGQIEAVIDALDDFGEAGEIRVLTGDFNEGPTDGSVGSSLTAEGFVDTWAELAPSGDAGLTMPASSPTNRIDYIWLDAGASAAEPVEAAVFLDQSVGGIFGSDHLGVMAVIR